MKKIKHPKKLPRKKNKKLFISAMVGAAAFCSLTYLAIHKPKKDFNEAPIIEQLLPATNTFQDAREMPKGKRSITIDLMIHGTSRQASCDLPATLRKFNPDAIFLEGGSVKSKKSAVSDEARINNPRIRLLFSQSDGPLEIAYEYSMRGMRSRIMFAESYDERELAELAQLTADYKKARNDSAKALESGLSDEAILHHKTSIRKLAQTNLIRNDRIVRTINLAEFRNAVLLVGDAHENVIRLLSEAGIGVSVVKNLDLDNYLVRYYEEKFRGWKTRQIDEDQEAVHELLSMKVGMEYARLGFGDANSAMIVAHQAIPRTITADEFARIRQNPSCGQNLIRCLIAKGIRLMDTKYNFSESLRNAGMYGCRLAQR